MSSVRERGEVRMPLIAVVAMLVAVVGAALVGRTAERLGVVTAKVVDGRWAMEIEAGEDHIGAVELANQLLLGDGRIEIVDLRPRHEARDWSLPGSHNLSMPELLGEKGDAIFARDPRLVVLCSRGTTHPGQAWVELRRRGRGNVKVLEGGIDGFRRTMLSPASLRPTAGLAPDPRAIAFLALCCAAFDPLSGSDSNSEWARDPERLVAPCVVSSAWLEKRLGEVAIVDVRPEIEFGLLHVPGAVHLDVETLRSSRGQGHPKVLRPDSELAAIFGKLGIADATPVVLVASDRQHDATLVALALLRIEHRAVALLDGGFLRWVAQRRAATTEVVSPEPVAHGEGIPGDDFTAVLDEVADGVAEGALRVVDTRSELEFCGRDRRDAERAGHVPKAIWLYPESLYLAGSGTTWCFRKALEPTVRDAFGDGPAVVMCHSGHRASAAFFVARYLFGRTDVRWFEGSWLAWAARSDLPIETAVDPARMVGK